MSWQQYCVHTGAGAAGNSIKGNCSELEQQQSNIKDKCSKLEQQQTASRANAVSVVTRSWKGWDALAEAHVSFQQG